MTVYLGFGVVMLTISLPSLDVHVPSVDDDFLGFHPMERHQQACPLNSPHHQKIDNLDHQLHCPQSLKDPISLKSLPLRHYPSSNSVVELLQLWTFWSSFLVCLSKRRHEKRDKDKGEKVPPQHTPGSLAVQIKYIKDACLFGICTATYPHKSVRVKMTRNIIFVYKLCTDIPLHITVSRFYTPVHDPRWGKVTKFHEEKERITSTLVNTNTEAGQIDP